MLRWPLPSVVSVDERSTAPVNLIEGGGGFAGVTVTALLVAVADPYAFAAVTEHETAWPPSADTVVYEAERGAGDRRAPAQPRVGECQRGVSGKPGGRAGERRADRDRPCERRGAR